jgi:hypothetical protein
VPLVVAAERSCPIEWHVSTNMILIVQGFAGVPG